MLNEKICSKCSCVNEVRPVTLVYCPPVGRYFSICRDCPNVCRYCLEQIVCMIPLEMYVIYNPVQELYYNRHSTYQWVSQDKAELYREYKKAEEMLKAIHKWHDEKFYRDKWKGLKDCCIKKWVFVEEKS